MNVQPEHIRAIDPSKALGRKERRQIRGEGVGEFTRKRGKWEEGDKHKVTTRHPGKKGDPLARSRDRR